MNHHTAHHLTRAALWIALCASSPWAHAAASPGKASASPSPGTQAYRCLDAAGHATYSQLPCAQQAERLRFKDDRTEAQLRQSMEVQQRDTALSRKVTREREHAEKLSASVPARAIVVAGKPPASPAVTATVKPKKDPHRRKRGFAAKVPKPPIAP